MTTKSPFALEEEHLREILLGTLQGTWDGEGTDTFPTPGGPQITKYHETMTFGKDFTTVNPGGPGHSQTLVGIHYFTFLVNASSGAPMHQETGYWLYDTAHATFMKSIAIPRGISILAGGSYASSGSSLHMVAGASNTSNEYGIANSQFLNSVAPTTRFSTQMQIRGDQFTYYESSILKIQGQDMNHTDQATLIKQ